MKKNFFDKLLKNNDIDTKIIVEVSGNHQGTYRKLKELINCTINQKVDAVKFQVYTADTISLKSKNRDFFINSQKKWKGIKSRYEIYEKAHTPWDWIEKLSKNLNKNNIPWFASPFDDTALNFLEDINCPAYKIASPEINDLNLIENVANKKKPIIISTGMASLKDLDVAVQIIRKKHNKIAILKCTSSYPAEYENLNLNLIKYLQKRYSCTVGYSDHSIGQLASIVATSLGAKIIEKHFKLDNDIASIDSHFSMDISEYSNFKNNITLIAKMIGNKINFPKIIPRKLKNERRSLYVIENIKKGQKFTNKNIKSIRPGMSLSPIYLKKFLGRLSKKNIKCGSRLSLKFI